MSLQSAIEAELPFLRSEAEARMRGSSRATVRRRGAPIGQDESTGAKTYAWLVTHTNIPCRIARSVGAATRTVTVAGQEMQVAVREAHFPAATSNLRDSDLVEITSGENAGMVLRIIESDWQDQATARRIPVLATERPVEWT